MHSGVLGKEDSVLRSHWWECIAKGLRHIECTGNTAMFLMGKNESMPWRIPDGGFGPKTKPGKPLPAEQHDDTYRFRCHQSLHVVKEVDGSFTDPASEDPVMCQTHSTVELMQ